MKKFFLLLLLVSSSFSSNYILSDANLSSFFVKKPQAFNIPTPTKNSLDELPLFDITCDNIAYSGALEQVAINYLKEVRQFIKDLTDPLVNTTKFESMLFRVALVLCLKENITKLFKPSESSDPTVQELWSRLIGALGNTKELGEVIGGVDANPTTAHFGLVGEATFNYIKTASVAAKALMKGVYNGIIDDLLNCTFEKRKMLMRGIYSILNNNFGFKVGIIKSINSACSVKLVEEGEKPNWSEALGVDFDSYNEAVADYAQDLVGDDFTVSVNGVTGALSDANNTCINGYDPIGNGKCLMPKDRDKLFSALSISDVNATDYTMFLERNATIKPSVPTAELKNITAQFFNLKASYGVSTDSMLDYELNRLYSDIFAPSFIIFTGTGSDDIENRMVIPFPFFNTEMYKAYTKEQKELLSSFFEKTNMAKDDIDDITLRNILLVTNLNSVTPALAYKYAVDRAIAYFTLRVEDVQSVTYQLMKFPGNLIDGVMKKVSTADLLQDKNRPFVKLFFKALLVRVNSHGHLNRALEDIRQQMNEVGYEFNQKAYNSTETSNMLRDEEQQIFTNEIIQQ